VPDVIARAEGRPVIRECLEEACERRVKEGTGEYQPSSTLVGSRGECQVNGGVSPL
jgi:hypothetical protein